MCQGLFFVEKGTHVALYRKTHDGRTSFVVRVGLVRRLYFTAVMSLGTFAGKERIACHDEAKPGWLVVAPAIAVRRLCCEHCQGHGSVMQGRCYACRGKGWLARVDRQRHAQYTHGGPVHIEQAWLTQAV